MNFRLSWPRRTIVLLAFGISFGYVEAAVVDYLRLLYQPARQHFFPDHAPGDLFPLLTLEQVHETGPNHGKLIGVEALREAATIVMLAAVALALARCSGDWLAAFAIAFGTWDISFYVFLKVLLGWPSSMLTWDLLFLLPVPWSGPVLAPIIVSATMILGGFLYLSRGWNQKRRPMRLWQRVGIFAGAFIIIMAFTWDFRYISAGGIPRVFRWDLFALGEFVAVLSFASGIWTGRTRAVGPPRTV